MVGMTKPRNMHKNHSVLQNQRLSPLFFLILPGFRGCVIHFFGHWTSVTYTCVLLHFQQGCAELFLLKHSCVNMLRKSSRVEGQLWHWIESIGVDKHQEAVTAVVLSSYNGAEVLRFSSLQLCRVVAALHSADVRGLKAFLLAFSFASRWILVTCVALVAQWNNQHETYVFICYIFL